MGLGRALPVTVVVVGAGVRGRNYGDVALGAPDRLLVTHVVEPDDARREAYGRAHAVPEENRLRDWRELAKRPRLAQAAFVTTQDADHAGPVEALAARGYDLLLEKPMAPDVDGCARVVRAVETAGVICAVCHVLRYTPVTRRLVELVRAGAVGEVVNVEHLEPVGHWHMAHSFVRGNWRREDLSSPMLLAKSCHDLDWIRYVVGRPCRAVASFGSLLHFRRDQKPPGAGSATRCLECAVERSCAYSAVRIYGERLARGETGWPVDVVVDPPTPRSLDAALAEGPYGRCVYECDNDVVDHQVVAMEFEGGASASFTMTAFSEHGHRRSRIFGTAGQLETDGETIRRFDFVSQAWTVENVTAADASITGGHGGGDDELVLAFADAVARRDPSLVLSDVRESFETHLMVFAAEQSRREGRLVRMAEVDVVRRDEERHDPTC